MGEAKHTPGPWVAKREDWKGEPVEHKVYIAGDRRECCDDDDDEGPVEPYYVSTAVAIVEGNRTSGPVTAANAALIAAAPLMFDYISARAKEGDPDAAKIIASVFG